MAFLHRKTPNIAFISLLIDKIDQSETLKVVPIYHHQLVNIRLHSCNSFIATSQPLLYIQANRSLCRVVGGIRQQPHEIRHTSEFNKKSELDWWSDNKYWDGPQLIFIDDTYIRPVLEALYNKLVPLVQCVHVRFWYMYTTLWNQDLSNTFWDGPHIIYVHQLYLYFFYNMILATWWSDTWIQENVTFHLLPYTTCFEAKIRHAS